MEKRDYAVNVAILDHLCPQNVLVRARQVVPRCLPAVLVNPQFTNQHERQGGFLTEITRLGVYCPNHSTPSRNIRH